jgi:hypothetical protein
MTSRAASLSCLCRQVRISSKLSAVTRICTTPPKQGLRQHAKRQGSTSETSKGHERLAHMCHRRHLPCPPPQRGESANTLLRTGKERKGRACQYTVHKPRQRFRSACAYGMRCEPHVLVGEEGTRRGMGTYVEELCPSLLDKI